MASRVETIINEIHAALPQPTLVEKAIGRLAHHEHATGPRISWIPIGGPTEPPSNIGGKLNEQATARDNQIATRVLQVDAYCWAPRTLGPGVDDTLGELEALEQCEQLVHDVILAASEAAGTTDVLLTRERWITQEDATRAGWRVDGQLCVLEFTFRIPVIKSARLWLVTDVVDQCKITFDGGQTYESGH